MIWPHPREELYSFISALNEVHQTIKFTVDISETHVNFLDVTVYKDQDGKITTGLYTKPTDAHMYLHFTSFHPKHQNTSIPYSQAIRLRRICSTPELFKEATQNLATNLHERGYPRQLIRSAIQKATAKDRESLFQPINARNNAIRIMQFTVIYNPINPPINKICNKNRHILSSAADSQGLQEYRFMIVNKRATNLKQLLTKTDVNPMLIPKGSGPCNSQCISCKFLKHTGAITVWVTGETIPIHGRFNCKTTNAIYVLSCAKCGLQYVGQTGNTFNERFRAHLTDIRQGNTAKPVSQHFTSTGHGANHVVATIMTQTTADVNVRLRTEEVWIAIFKSKQPLGLNINR